MAMYEYKCNNCGTDFEFLLLRNEEIMCPKCGSKNLEKKFSRFSSSSSADEHCDRCDMEDECSQPCYSDGMGQGCPYGED